MSTQFENIPNELLINIFNLLNNETLSEVRLSNKAIYKIINDNFNKETKPRVYIDLYDYDETNNYFNDGEGQQVKYIEVLDDEQFMGFKPLPIIENIPEWYPSFWQQDITSIKFPNLIHLKVTLDDNQNCPDLDEMVDNMKDILYQLEIFELNVLSDVDLDRFIKHLNPSKLKVLKINNSYGDALILQDIKQFKKFTLLHELYLEFRKLEMSGSNLPLDEYIIFPSLKKLSIIGEEYNDLDFKSFGKLSNSIEITLKLNPGQEDSEKFINETNLNNLILDYYCNAYEYKGRDGIDLVDFINELKPTLIEGKFKKINVYYLSDVEYNNKQINKGQQFNKIQSINFIYCSIPIQAIFEILTYFPDVNKVRLLGCDLSDSNEKPLVHPIKSNDFLLISDTKSFDGDDKFQKLLEDINTYIY